MRRDTTNSLLNPTTGTRVTLEVTPYTGTFNGPLTTVRTRLDASGYWSPGWDRPRARRTEAAEASLAKCPEYSGLVVFYKAVGRLRVLLHKYQSLGPHDRNGDPLGGLSFTDVSLEARFRITESFGIVPFVDGGMVYEITMPD